MQTAQINSPRFNYEPTVQAPRIRHTLNDYRIFPADYSAVSNFTPRSARPVLISVLVAALVAGAAIGIHRYNENTAAKITPAQETVLPAAPAATAADTVTAPAAALPAEVAPAPAQNVIEPAPAPKARANVVAKPVAPKKAAPVQDIATPIIEAQPPAPPVVIQEPTPAPAPVIEPKPVIPPAPAPADPSVEPPKN